jgi:hypothetical protein
MWAEFVNRSHPFLIWRIVGPVGNFRDLTQSLSCRLQEGKTLAPAARFSLPTQNWFIFFVTFAIFCSNSVAAGLDFC